MARLFRQISSRVSSPALAGKPPRPSVKMLSVWSFVLASRRAHIIKNPLPAQELTLMSRRNRRQFLEDSMFAAAAAAMAAHDGRPTYAQEPQSKSPNERLNVAIAGVTGRGASHIGNLAGRNDVTVTHIVDVDSGV